MVKPTANFASRQKRFEDPNAVATLADGGPGVQTTIPGPGSYEHSQPWQSLNKKGIKWQQPIAMQKVALPNAPSIPSHNNIFGYEENNRGELIQQKNTEITYQGHGVDRVGPANYNPPSKKKLTGPLTEWKNPTKPPKKIQIIQKEKKGV